MKRRLQFLFLWCILIFHVHASVKMVGSYEELNGLIINCHPNYSIIVEFPKDITILKVIQENENRGNWVVDHDLNLLWAQPETLNSPDCSFKVLSDIYEDIELKLRVEKESRNLIHTIVLEQNVFNLKDEKKEHKELKTEGFQKDKIVHCEVEKEKITKFSEIQQTFAEVKSGSEKTSDSNDRIVDTSIQNKRDENTYPLELETYFSLSGGMQNFEDSSFVMDGEIIVAGKSKKGFFFQGAGKVSINKITNQFGFSAGGGFEPGKLGLFMFADSLMQKTGEEYDSTTHFQIRPGVRYRLSDKVYLSGFFAFPIGSWQYTGVEVPGESGLGYYNKSLAHGGVDLSVYYKRIFLELRTLIAEGSAFGVDIKAGFEFINKIFVTINYAYQTSGEHEYLNEVSTLSRVGIGINFNMRNSGSGDNKRIIFRPDYPMVAIAKKEIEEGSSSNPEISLAGNPVTGYAPLNVSYQATLKGFQGDVELTWFFNTAYSSTSSNRDCAFTYTLPGTYECYVTGKDNSGNVVRSNIVAITVLDGVISDNEFSIVSSVSSGTGSITPLGSTIVKFGEDQKFSITPADGWYINNVNVDNKSVGAISEYIFKKVDQNHVIEVEFTDTPQNSYTVTGTVRNNQYGSIDPVTTQVAHGSSVTLKFTPEDSNKQTICYWLNGQLHNDEGAGSVTIDNVTSDQTVEVEFGWIYYDVTVTLTLENGGSGSVDPGPGKFTFKSGQNLTFNFNPESNSFIRQVFVDGNNKGSINTLKIYDLGEDKYIDVYMKRNSYPIDAEIVGGGCGCNITSSQGQSGAGTYEVFHGDDITFYFDPLNTSQTYWLGVKDGGSWSVMLLPNSYKFQNVAGGNNYFRIKCADPGDPPPFAP